MLRRVNFNGGILSSRWNASIVQMRRNKIGPPFGEVDPVNARGEGETSIFGMSGNWVFETLR